MDAIDQDGFAFRFGDESRAELLAEAHSSLSRLGRPRPDTYRSGPAATAAAALQLLGDLQQAQAEFGACPEIYALDERHFAEHGRTVPACLKDLSRRYRFYWVRLPIILHALQNLPFKELECVVEFNPADRHEPRRPLAHQIFPGRRFEQLLELSDRLDVALTEDLEFSLATGQISLAAAGRTPNAALDIDWHGGMGLVVGPFSYRLKKARIEHNAAGSEKVFWRISGAEYFEEHDLPLIIVLKVPKEVPHVRIAAALQAYHSPNLAAMGLGEVMRHFSDRVAAFLKSGAPVRNPVQGTKVWDISQRL